MSNRYRVLLPVAVGLVSLVGVALITGGVELPSTIAQTQDIAWVQQFGTPADEAITSVSISPLGDVGVVGWTNGVLPGDTSAGSRDAFARIYNSTGSLVWSHQFGSAGADTTTDAEFDAAGNLVVVGQVRGALPGQHQSGPADAFVRKYTRGGAELWTRQFGVAGESAASRVDAHSSTDVFIGGWVYGALPGQKWQGQYDAFIRQYDPGGSELATIQFGSQQHDRVEALNTGPLGDIFVVVASDHDSNFNGRRNTKNHFLHAFDKSKKQTRKMQAPLSDVDEVIATRVTNDGAVVVVGQEVAEHGHAFVAKIDNQNKESWAQHIQITGNDIATAAAMDASGAIYVAGYTGTSATSGGDVTSIWVQKYTSDGKLVWTRQEGSGMKDVLSDVTVTDDGTVYLAGWTTGAFSGQNNLGRSDAFIMKLV